MKQAGNSPSSEFKAAVKERDGFRCVFCGSPRHLTIDHIVPRALGGGNNIENLQTLCGRCNRDKGASMPAGIRRSHLDPRLAGLLAVLAALLVLAAPAGATTIVAPAGTIVPYQKWADESKVATPQMVIVVDEEAAICGVKGACTGPGDPIWINPWLVGEAFPEIRKVFLHEMGHHFDYYVMQDWARARFQQLVGDFRPWTEDPNAPNEKFAEAWRFCAELGPRLLRAPTAWGYDYRPYRKLHYQACHLIRRVAAG